MSIVILVPVNFFEIRRTHAKKEMAGITGWNTKPELHSRGLVKSNLDFHDLNHIAE